MTDPDPRVEAAAKEMYRQSVGSSRYMPAWDGHFLTAAAAVLAAADAVGVRLPDGVRMGEDGSFVANRVLSPVEMEAVQREAFRRQGAVGDRPRINLWRCPECEWVGVSVDGHCRQFDEHPDGPRIPLVPVVYERVSGPGAVQSPGEDRPGRTHDWLDDDGILYCVICGIAKTSTTGSTCPDPRVSGGAQSPGEDRRRWILDSGPNERPIVHSGPDIRSGMTQAVVPEAEVARLRADRDHWRDEAWDKRQRVGEREEALRFYADKAHYTARNPPMSGASVWHDSGEIARAALAAAGEPDEPPVRHAHATRPDNVGRNWSGSRLPEQEAGFRGTNEQRHPWFQQEPRRIGRIYPPPEEDR